MEKPIQKQISIYIPREDWRLLNLEAIRRRMPLTALVRETLQPLIEQLRRGDDDRAA